MYVCGAQGGQAAHLSMRLCRLIGPFLHAQTICSDRGHVLHCFLDIHGPRTALAGKPTWCKYDPDVLCIFKHWQAPHCQHV